MAAVQPKRMNEVNFVREVEVTVDTEEIAEFLFHKLIERGFAPSEEELEEVADIVFEYLIHKGIIEEE